MAKLTKEQLLDAVYQLRCCIDEHGGGGTGGDNINIMTQAEFDAVLNKSSLGTVGISNNGYEITKMYNCNGVVKFYSGAYMDSSPVTYTVDVNAPVLSVTFVCPGDDNNNTSLYRPSDVVCEAILEGSEDWVTLFTDDANTEGVWAESALYPGYWAYNRKYSFGTLTKIKSLRISFIACYRVSCNILFKTK